MLIGLLACGGVQELDEQAKEELALCGHFPVPLPTGEFVDQGRRIDYERLAPRKDPNSGDRDYFFTISKDPRLLEQLYSDAASGNQQAAWAACVIEAGARHGGRMVAKRLQGLACQTIARCRAEFDALPFSRETASGVHMVMVVAAEFETHAAALEIQQELISNVLSVLVGANMARGIRGPPHVGSTGSAPRFRVLNERELANVRGAGPTRGFSSFAALKRALGPAGPGKHWHHIVEQTPGNVARFGAEPSAVSG